MRCPSCGTDNSVRVKFCSECGAPMGVACPDCGYRNSRDAAACGQCGRSLVSAEASTAERRQLTVFFADIVGSTELAEKLDPEDLRELYARYQAICADVLHRYDGYLAQHLGDGVLAYFGYPAAHEDDAARAVHTGLEILAQAGNISIGGNHPRVRIGIHTGLVVVGDVGGAMRREQLALGEAPNIAARLQSEALPDSLVISDATRKLLAGQFVFEILGSRTLKGLSRPLEIFRVIGKSGAASRFQAMTTAHGLTPLVGRERETGLIRAAWAEAGEGRGSTLLLRGEAGIGKSRLLEAARQVAASRLHEVFDAQCSPYQMNSPLDPIMGMIKRRLGMEDTVAEANKLDLIELFVAGRGGNPEETASALAGLFSVPTLGRYAQIEMSPAKGLQWTISVIADLLLHSVGGSPVLLLIEDLHWADPSTLDLLGEIVARQSNLPVLMVCTARPEFSAAWLDRPPCREIRVEALPPEDTRALVARVAGRKPLPPALVEELVARTGGIPLFAEAVTRTVIGAGILRELDDRYELAGPLPPGLIPATLQDSLMASIDRLGADRPVAQLAATIGRESSFELLQLVLVKSTELLTAALRHLVDLELVSESGVPPASTYIFRHALIQDAAYESLLRKTRQEFHNKIAEVLTNRFPEMAETKPELLARHFEGAGRTAEATAGWMKAGSLAQQRSAARECVAHLRKAIALLETLPDDDPNRLRSELDAQGAISEGLKQTLGWASPQVEAASIRARDLSHKLGDTTALLRALIGLASLYFVRGSLGQSMEASKPILQMALESRNPGLQQQARAIIGYSAYFLADFPQAREHAEAALALYDLEREREIVAILNQSQTFTCANYLVMSLWFMGYPDQAERARRNAWAVVDALAVPLCTAYAFGTAIMLDYAQRDVPSVIRMAEKAEALSIEEGSLLWAIQARIYRGWAQAMKGEAEAGIAQMQAGLDSYRMTGSGLMTTQFCLMMAEAQFRAGRPDEALAEISKGLRHAAENQEHVHEPELHRLKGEILLAQGTADAGEASLRDAIQLAQAQQAKMLELRAALALAKVWRDHGRVAEARTLLQPLDEWFVEGRDMPELRETQAILESTGARRKARKSRA